VSRIAAALLIASAIAACSARATPPSLHVPAASVSAAPTVDASLAPDDPAAGLPYGCGWQPFDIRTLSTAPGAEGSSDPAAAGLRGAMELDSFLPRSGWWLVSRTATEAQYIARKRGDVFAAVLVEATGGGRWGVRDWGDCVLSYVRTNRVTEEWAVAPAGRPAPADRTIHVTVVEKCQRDPLDKRLDPPTIRITVEAVLVVFTASAGRDIGDMCAPARPFRTTVELDTPLGNRQLLDGAHWPARDATSPLVP
jgi:hypothetical protein